jgi:hypothetical protein
MSLGSKLHHNFAPQIELLRFSSRKKNNFPSARASRGGKKFVLIRLDYSAIKRERLNLKERGIRKKLGDGKSHENAFLVPHYEH